MSTPDLVGLFTLMHQENKRMGLVEASTTEEAPMSTLKSNNILYGVHETTLAAYVAAERAKVYGLVADKMLELNDNQHGDDGQDWFLLYDWCRTYAKETP